MTMIENLYYGKISPAERDIVKGSAEDELISLLCRNNDKLSETLTEAQKETFEKFKECHCELSELYERDAFTQGFTLGARLNIEILSNK